jgi:squalene cyclase
MASEVHDIVLVRTMHTHWYSNLYIDALEQMLTHAWTVYMYRCNVAVGYKEETERERERVSEKGIHLAKEGGREGGEWKEREREREGGREMTHNLIN